MREVLVLDNYDSFTYNLVQYLEMAGVKAVVVRNDKLTVDEAMQYREIILSPGPGLPADAGIMNALIKAAAPTHKILGVCLGHQAIAEVFGGSLYNMSEVFHGVSTVCRMDNSEPLFEGLPGECLVGRYHSWSVAVPLPESLEITAADKTDASCMALRHKKFNVRGVQFHPESILTEHGHAMIRNWVNLPI